MKKKVFKATKGKTLYTSECVDCPFYDVQKDYCAYHKNIVEKISTCKIKKITIEE